MLRDVHESARSRFSMRRQSRLLSPSRRMRCDRAMVFSVLARPQLFRPSELARFWELHPKTVYLWIREGRLQAVRTPGDQFRVRAEDVIAFCVASGMALPPFVQPTNKQVLLAGGGPRASRALKRALASDGVHVTSTTSALEGLFTAISLQPRVIAVDAALLGSLADEAVRAVKRAKGMQRTKIVAFNVTTQHRADLLEQAGAVRAVLRDDERDLGIVVLGFLS
jgi:excisionase family DNA binding protein